MNEEIIISGRNLPGIDPSLHIWHWPISLYLFLGGLAAGILFFATYYVIRGKEDEMPTAIKRATFLVPFALIIGLAALIYDLKHPLYSWQLYTTIRLESPMSWGAWTLMAVTPLSILWVASYMTELFPRWDWKFEIFKTLEKLVIKYRVALAWVIIVLAVILGIYTGILLSAFNARPLWNNAILGPLFLTSGLSTAAATIMWMAKTSHERNTFRKIDLLLITIELFFIIHLFMGFLAGPQVQQEAAQLFLGGDYTVSFWIFVVFLGLIFPGILEIMEIRGYKIPVALPAALILIGGLVFRIIMVNAGQLTRYLY